MCRFFSHGGLIVNILRAPNLKVGFLFILVFVSGCSMFSLNEKPASSSKVVPKEQYDLLWQKYQALLDQTSTSPSNQSQNALSADPLTETVNLFVDGENAPKKISDNELLNADLSVLPQDEEITSLRSAEALVLEQKYAQAFKFLKELEKSKNRQIGARAKFLIGESLIAQKEYDLAMQVFEEIVERYAFSGVIFKTLDRLILCCEKLQLTKKKEQYHSILHDFFESV